MWLFSVISEQIVFWLLKVNNANTRATCEICSKLTIDIRTTSSTFLVETCEVISEVQRKKKQQKKKKKHSVGTNSSKSSILLQSCYLWKRNCKLMKIENGFLPVSLPISKIFLKMLRLHDTLYEKKTLELFVIQVQLTIMFFIRMSFG